jgi:diguanylate cyclase (GGDEF)-like protein/PAS domain S-box-containing protein
VRLAIVAGLALVAVHGLSPEGSVREWSYLAVVAGASAMAWRGARRSEQPGIARLIALGVLLTSAGDVTYQILVWRGDGTVDISIADVAWLGSYVALAMALVRVLLSGSSLRRDLEAWVDVGAVSVLALLVQWELGLKDLMSDASAPALARVVWSLYPVLDAVLLALVLRALVARRLRGRSALFVGGGVVCWLASDLIYSVSSPEGPVAAWLDAGWLLAAMALALAALEPRSASTLSVEPDRSRGAGRGRALVGLLPLLVPSAIEVIGYLNGEDPNPVPLALATALLVALALIRTLLLMGSDRAARARLRSQEQFSRAVAANSSDAVAIVDAHGAILNDACALAELVGYDVATLAGEDLFTDVDEADIDAARAVFERCVQSPSRVFETELRVRRVDGRLLWVGARLVNLLEDPDLRGIVVTMHDITQRKAAEHELEHQAFHDGLTGLANRALFADRVDQALLRSERSGQQPAVIYLDLDGFKTVNDSLGHGAGDALLRVVARRLKVIARAGDTVARLGGDEFAILIEPSDRPVDDGETMAERILQALSFPAAIEDQIVRASASLGITVGSPSCTATSMLRDADVAMYRAKTAGKAQWVVYDATMRTAAVERLQLETDLIRALDEDQFVLVYQPVVELETDHVIGFEALIRWHHPTLGVVRPDRFIPLAEESGLILPIGAWVLDQACRTAARWLRSYPQHPRLSMAVNVSGHQLGSPDFVRQVQGALVRSGLDPANLVLEMTETALVRDPATTAAKLHELRALGIRLAIDDFGTGYSSLSYLRQFPVDILKIDRSFVDSITERDQVPAILRGLLDLGRTLELETIAEGVENELQRDRLREEGCNLAQGYLFARPLGIADAEALLFDLDVLI